ncbi:MAG: thiol-disulfide isomerase [Candidatus Omnitrophica bacterium]|nr:thiol-disulfide isomerase [Candidatus Omnitrophota bacterium]
MSKEDERTDKKRPHNGKKKNRDKIVLRLYVTGLTPRSQKAIENIKKLCREHMGDEEYELSICDIYQEPLAARNGQVVAAPTLIKELPPPLRKFIGDMSDTDKLVAGLELHTPEEEE